MTESERCMAEIAEPPHYIHRHRCERPAKGVRYLRSWNLGATVQPVCGIHLRQKYAPYLWEPT